MNCRGLIAAAGLSSRMDGFKPLMELNGFPMIQMTVQSLRNGGIRDITVVTGYRGEEMERVLAPLHVQTVRNERYRETDMLSSIRLGLAQAEAADAVFFLPGDLPLLAPGSMKKLKNRLREISNRTDVLIPLTGGQTSHPPVLFPGGCRSVLRYRGEKGLKGAFSSMEAEYIRLDDPGALADADRREDFAGLEAYAKEHKGASRKLCESWYEETGLPAHIRAHCLAVGELAGELAQKLTEHGACLDVELCRSGGYVHDLCRLSRDHEAAAGAFLRKKGYLALAKTAEGHGGFEEEPETVCEERVLVCLADKLIQEDRRVTLDVRYQKAFACTPVKERIQRTVRICRKLMEEFEVITGEKL